MGNEFNYKSKGVRTSDPFPKDSIPMHKINWEVYYQKQQKKFKLKL